MERIPPIMDKSALLEKAVEISIFLSESIKYCMIGAAKSRSLASKPVSGLLVVPSSVCMNILSYSEARSLNVGSQNFG